MTPRKNFPLFEDDESFLNEYGLTWETIIDGSQWVLLHSFSVPEGYNHSNVTAAIRLETGYPQTPLDMVYFHPPLSRNDQKPIPATSTPQIIEGKTYQRWSRHRTTSNPWRPREDNLENHIFLIEDWLEREFNQ